MTDSDFSLYNVDKFILQTAIERIAPSSPTIIQYGVIARILMVKPYLTPLFKELLTRIEFKLVCNLINRYYTKGPATRELWKKFHGISQQKYDAFIEDIKYLQVGMK